MSFVLDASTVAAVMPGEDSSFARAALVAAFDDSLIVPSLWSYEVQNGLALAWRRQRVDADSAKEAVDALREMRAELEAPQRLGQEFR